MINGNNGTRIHNTHTPMANAATTAKTIDPKPTPWAAAAPGTLRNQPRAETWLRTDACIAW
jgi:hypothetical protein